VEDAAENGDSTGTEVDIGSVERRSEVDSTKEDGTMSDGGSGSSVSRAVEVEFRVEEQLCSITKSQGSESKVEVTGSV
jgi:hypothetical protein